MVNSVYDSCFNLHLLLLDIVEKNTAIKFAGTVSAADTQKAQAMFNNMMSISLPPKREMLLSCRYSSLILTRTVSIQS